MYHKRVLSPLIADVRLEQAGRGALSAVFLSAKVHCSSAKPVLHQLLYGIEIGTTTVSYFNCLSVGGDDLDYADIPTIASAIALHMVYIFPGERHRFSKKRALARHADVGDKGGGIRDESDKNHEGRNPKGNRGKADNHDNGILGDSSGNEEFDNSRKPQTEDQYNKNKADTAHNEASSPSCIAGFV
jgi:hypothetical protein